MRDGLKPFFQDLVYFTTRVAYTSDTNDTSGTKVKQVLQERGTSDMSDTNDLSATRVRYKKKFDFVYGMLNIHGFLS